VLFLHSRRNEIALAAGSPLQPKAESFERRFARFDDVVRVRVRVS
tara:strand:+ start:388 stop:522 length:135 start_codon:yes stop_codon:yes gene_type:complete